MRPVTGGFLCSYLALQVGELSSKLGLQSVGQLVVNWTCQLLLNSLFIQDLQHTEGATCGERVRHLG